MIGGGMLLCAVGAMILLAVWSLKYDEMPDAKLRDGLLALRSFTETKRYKMKNQADAVDPEAEVSRTARKLQPLRFDPDEMAEIEDEAEMTMPQFLRDAREEY